MRTFENDSLKAVFLPETGMSLRSFQYKGIELMAPADFETRRAGYGALIGPHFHRRRPGTYPAVPDPSRFAHIPYMETDPFSHGVGRYAPWNYEVHENRIEATLSGKDVWMDVPLADIEGQNFTLKMTAELHPSHLEIDLSVVSDTDSVVGLHYYWAVPPSDAMVRDGQEVYDFSEPVDKTLHPYPNPLEGEVYLETTTHTLRVQYKAPSQEVSCQLWRPEGAPFVCIEPISAQDPRHPNLSVSTLNVQLIPGGVS